VARIDLRTTPSLQALLKTQNRRPLNGKHPHPGIA
jgi:hypothetical protein